MAKDPAFLFYSSDFLIGTAFFSNDQIGKYIKLLCYQHQLGHLSEEQVLEICKGKDDLILAKFKKDNDGLYFNERLDAESEKRKSFCESRRMARMSGIEEKKPGKKDPKKRAAKPGFTPPTVEMVQAYKKERGNTTVNCQRFIDFYTANGWKQGRGKPIVDWKSAFRLWENREDAPAPMAKRPVNLRVLEYKAAKWDDRRIVDQLLGEKYTEHEINEAIGKRF
jgi:hypothetical protein